MLCIGEMERFQPLICSPPGTAKAVAPRMSWRSRRASPFARASTAWVSPVVSAVPAVFEDCRRAEPTGEFRRSAGSSAQCNRNDAQSGATGASPCPGNGLQVLAVDDDLHDGCGDRLYEPQPAHNRRHCRAAEFEYSDFLGLGQLDRAAALTGISRCGHDRSGSTRRSYDVGLRMFRRPQLLHCPNQGGSVAKKAASTTKSVPTVLPPYLANEKQ